MKKYLLMLACCFMCYGVLAWNVGDAMLNTNQFSRVSAVQGVSIKDGSLQTNSTLFSPDVIMSGATGSVEIVYNVLEMGAAGNGVADDTPVIQRAFNLASTNNLTGKSTRIKIPGGTYRITNNVASGVGLRLLADNVTVEGDGTSTILKCDATAMAAGIHMIEQSGTNQLFRNMVFDGSWDGVSLSDQDALTPQAPDGSGPWKKFHNLRYENLFIHNMANEGIDIDYSNVTNVPWRPTIFISGCMFSNIAHTGIEGAHWTIIQRSHFERCGLVDTANGAGAVNGRNAIVMEDCVVTNSWAAIGTVGGDYQQTNGPLLNLQRCTFETISDAVGMAGDNNVMRDCIFYIRAESTSKAFNFSGANQLVDNVTVVNLNRALDVGSVFLVSVTNSTFRKLRLINVGFTVAGQSVLFDNCYASGTNSIGTISLSTTREVTFSQCEFIITAGSAPVINSGAAHQINYFFNRLTGGNQNISVTASNRVIGNVCSGSSLAINASGQHCEIIGNLLIASTPISMPNLSNSVVMGHFNVPDVFPRGIATNGGGFKHSRLNTGSINATSSALITNSWVTGFTDTNYTVSASLLDPTASRGLEVLHVENITPTNVAVRVTNHTAGALTGLVHLIGIHD